jgi:hypothetical protein
MLVTTSTVVRWTKLAPQRVCTMLGLYCYSMLRGYMIVTPLNGCQSRGCNNSLSLFFLFFSYLEADTNK